MPDLNSLQRFVVSDIAEYFQLGQEQVTGIRIEQVRRTDFTVTFDGLAGRNWPYLYIHGTGAVRGALFQRESDSTLLVRLVRNPGI